MSLKLYFDVLIHLPVNRLGSSFPLTSKFSFAPLIGLALFGFGSLVFLISGVFITNPLSASKLANKGNGFYSLSQPIILSHSPKVMITEGKLRFLSGKVKKNSADILGSLPFNWTDLIITKKHSHAHLSEAKILIDFRDNIDDLKKAEGEANGLINRSVLAKSYLEHIHITDTEVKVYKNHSKPLVVALKTGEFQVDLSDGELEGTGQLKLGEIMTEFSLTHDFSKKTAKGVTLNQIEFELKNENFISKLDGILEGRRGLHFKGTASLHLNNINKSDFSFDQSARSKAIQFKTSGTLDWAGDEGTLSKARFKFGRNAAEGSLSLKLSQANPEVSGTLAFKTLDFSELHSLKRRAKKVHQLKETHSKNSIEETPLISALNFITPLIRNYDADVRLSADKIKVRDLSLKDAGFSLFQKNGELLIDIAGLQLLGGSATGLIKIDTNSPKPRWHINSGFKNLNLSDLKDILPHHSFLAGVGHLKLKMTSFGDKGDEIYENMSGSLNFRMPKGGSIQLDLKQFIGEQEHSSDKTLKDLAAGKSSFQFLNSIAHFAKGAVIFDHFMISTKSHDYTGHGFLNLKSHNLNWHIASWETTEISENSSDVDQSEKDGTSGKDNNLSSSARKEMLKAKSNKGEMTKAPILLTCSHIDGLWDQLQFEKYTALHLSLLNKACPAFYHFDPLKTKEHTIVHSDNAR